MGSNIGQNAFFHNKFKGYFKYVDDLEYKFNLTYLKLCLVLYTMTKNPKSIIWDILAIFNNYMDIKFLQQIIRKCIVLTNAKIFFCIFIQNWA